MRLLVSLLLITGTSALFLTDAGVPFNGLKGEALIRGISDGCRPAALADPNVAYLTLSDPFSGETVDLSNGSLPEGYEWGTLVSAEWWRESPAVYGDTVSRDLYNMMPLNADVRRWRGSRPIGQVVKADFSNGLWSAGLGLMAGEDFECYWPPEALRGRLARTYFYMAALYHVDVWASEAYLMMSGSRWPGLSRYAAEMLMEWHRTWPVSAAETALNERGEQLQGNRNPFVDYPDLAEYLWGSRQEQQFVIEDEPKALRGTYSMSEGRIDLWSPYVPDDAVWTADGAAVNGPWIQTAALGPGDHRLDYRSPSTGERGCVMIKITEK